MASRITAAWERLYSAQTRTLADTATSDLGTRQATVGTVTGNCILGVAALSDDLQIDGFAQGGDYAFTMLASAFEVPPEAQCPVRLPGIEAALVLRDFDLNNGVYQMTAIDPSKR
jgi:hypothetical protein